MTDPISRLEAAGAGVRPPDRAATFAKTQAGIASGYRPGHQTGRAAKVTGVVVAVAVVGLGGYFAAASLGGQPSPTPPGIAGTPTATPVNTSPTSVQLKEQALEALAADNLVWTIDLWGDASGPDWKTSWLTTTDGSVMLTQSYTEGDIYLEDLEHESDGVITSTVVHHPNRTWSTQSFPADSEGITPFTTTIPKRVALLKELIEAASDQGVESKPPGEGAAAWCFPITLERLPTEMTKMGAIEAEICLDSTTALPVLFTATYNNQALRNALLLSSSQPNLYLPDMLTQQEGDCWEVGLPDQQPPAGTCQASVQWSWATRSVERDPLALAIPPDYRQVALEDL